MKGHTVSAKIPPRIENNLLDTFCKYVSDIQGPALFKTWGGLSLLSAALSRRVWFKSSPVMPPIFPNLFVLLCAAPGSGKDLIINTVRDILIDTTNGMEQQQGVNIGPEFISTKGLIDALADEDSQFSFTYSHLGKPITTKYHSLYFANGELGTLIPEYSVQLISLINDLYNCKRSLGDQVRGRGAGANVKIENLHLAMLLGTQPAVFARIIPIEAFQTGFTSRLNICYVSEIPRKPFFVEEEGVNYSRLHDNIISDLRAICLMAGEYKVEKRFKEKLNDFHMTNPKPLTSSRFEDYNARRSFHLAKIAMCCAAAESNEMMLNERHFDIAMKYLQDAEHDVESLFDGLVTSQGFSGSVEQVLNKHEMKTITHAELERSLRKTHKPYEVGAIIRSMIQANDIVFTRYMGTMPVYTVQKEGVM